MRKNDFLPKCIHHTLLVVKDINVSIEFYEKLGFKLWHIYNKSEAGSKGALLRLGKTNLELFSYRNPEPLPENNKVLEKDVRIVGTRHIALGVDNIEKSYTELKKIGINFIDVPKIGSVGHKYSFFKDPNGILIELFEMKRA